MIDTRKKQQGEQERTRETFHVDSYYSKGTYTFTCSTTIAAARTIVPIINKITSPEQKLTAREYTLLVAYIHQVHHTDTEKSKSKLAGIVSVSTSVCDNSICAARRKDPDSICSWCFAANQQARQAGLREWNTINGLILRNVLIPFKYFRGLEKLVLSLYTRIESFGDTANVIQARNYIRIARANSLNRFAAW